MSTPLREMERINYAFLVTGGKHLGDIYGAPPQYCLVDVAGEIDYYEMKE